MVRRAVFLLVGLFVAAFAPRANGQCPDGTPPPCSVARRVAAAGRATPTPEARARRFVLLPFRNVTRAPAHDWLVTGGPLMLAEGLGQFRGLTVVPEDVLLAARRRLHLEAEANLDATQLRKLAEETDGWTAVTGNVLASGATVRVLVQAQDIPTSRVLVRAETQVKADADVRLAFDSLTIRLLSAAGARTAKSDVAALTTRSVDAYRAYVTGVGFMQQSAFRRAREAFAEAVRLDSTFAMAWANLAWATHAINPLSLTDPSTPITGFVAHALQNVEQLPPRQAGHVRMMAAFYNGRMRQSRALADSLIDTDRDDLDARAWYVGMQLGDPTLDTTVSPPRLLSHPNRGVALAKEILERDPGRRNVYSVLVMTYGMAGSVLPLRIPGVAGESNSYGALLLRAMTNRGALFRLVLRDSLLWMPVTEWEALSNLEKRELQQRADEAAMYWAERWLAAGPNDGEAHLWAARIADGLGDLPRALRETAVADSLGVGTSFELLTDRRLSLLARMRRYDEAIRLADSLLLIPPRPGPFTISLSDAGFRTSVRLYLLTKQWDRAAEVIRRLPPSPTGGPSCLNAVFGTPLLFSAGKLDFERAVADTVARYFGRVTTYAPLEPCIGYFAGGIDVDSLTGKRLSAARDLMRAADSLHLAGSEAFAFRAARVALNADTASRAGIIARPWFATRARAMAIGHHFEAGDVIVDGDSVSFSFRRVGVDSIEVTYPRLPNYWQIGVVVAGSRDTAFAIMLRHVYSMADSLMRGGIAAMLSAATQRSATINTRVASLSAGTLALRETPGGFTVVVVGRMAAAMRRARAATAVFSAEPCLGVGDGLCARPSVPVTYR